MGSYDGGDSLGHRPGLSANPALWAGALAAAAAVLWFAPRMAPGLAFAPWQGPLVAPLGVEEAPLLSAMIGRLFGAISMSDIKNKQTKTFMVLGVLVWAFIVSFYTLDWNLQMAMIFLGFAIVNFILMQIGVGNANRILAIFAVVAIILAVTSMLSTGRVALWTIVTIGLFNSIMFPNIFSLSVKGLDRSEVSLASGIINTMIVGGAVVPVIMGAVADLYNIEIAFIIPVICYGYILFFALVGSKIKPKEGAVAAATPSPTMGADPSHRKE